MPRYSEIDFIELIDGYETPDAARELIAETPPTLLTGISGAGKDSTKSGMLETGGFHEVISYTTRAPRMNNGEWEKDGVHYNFVSPEYMHNMAWLHKFVEIKRVHGADQELGDVYGTPIDGFKTARDLGKIAIADVDVQGVREYVGISPNTVALFILPPDYDTWRERLGYRYETPEAFESEWPKRYTSAIRELKEALSAPHFHFIINHELGRTVAIASEFARGGNVYNQKDTEARTAGYRLLRSIEENGLDGGSV